jgi:hypothetical protein
MKKILNEGNQIPGTQFFTVSVRTFVILFYYGSGSVTAKRSFMAAFSGHCAQKAEAGEGSQAEHHREAGSDETAHHGRLSH